MKKFTISFVFSVIIVLVLASIVLATPKDIRGHWAEDYITSLLNQNLINSYEDGTFRPNQAITRADFAETLAKSMYLEKMEITELTDIENHPAKGYISALVNEGIVTGFPDKTFRPEDKLTRAQVVTMLTRAFGLGKENNQINTHSFASYLDMDKEHWANDYVKVATELDILNGYPDSTFRPNNLTTRAEASKMINIFKDYDSINGFVADIYPASNKIAITSLIGERIILNIADTALIGRNNRIVPATEFLKTDKVFIITDSQKRARYIKAYGLITRADLTEQVSLMTDYMLDPFEVEAIAGGNFNVLKPKFLNEIRVRLMNYGLSPTEIEALLNTDWYSLEEQGRTRLSEAVAIQTGLPLGLVEAIMSQDWDKVQTLAKVEAIQRVVQQVMNSDLFS
ncbi:MAG: S-layer homology domain-containing protein [Halanaerobiales bacterium]|nr:S-layer homology domain-containing protein [Halanaerobiales bacterium]